MGAITTLTAGVLITFYAIKDTRPSGAAVMTILWIVFGVSLAWVALQDVCIGWLRNAGIQVPIVWRGFRAKTTAEPKDAPVIQNYYHYYTATTMHFDRAQDEHESLE